MYQISSTAASSSSSSSATEKNRSPKASAFVGQWHNSPDFFKMPLHYPRYTLAQFEAMDEERLDALLREYGLPFAGDVAQKRSDAIGHFIW